MKIEKTDAVTVTLSMCVAEAEWLMRILQNTFHGKNPEDEDSFTEQMRKRFFETLRIVL